MPRHRVPGRSFVDLGVTAILAAALAIGAPLATTAVAAPARKGEPAPPSERAEPDPLEQAQQLYDRGRAKFETADYRAAIELWTEAYANVPDTPEGNQVKVLLIYNLATAREKAFDVSRDPSELRQAQILLRNFEQSIDALYGEGEDAEAERLKVQQRIAALDERLAAFEAARADDEGDDGSDEPEPEPEPEPAPSPPDDVVDEPPVPSRRGLVIGGAVTAGLGVAGLGVMGAGLAMGAGANDISGLAPDDVDARRAQFDRGRLGNTLGVVGGVAGGALLVTGAVLLSLGMRRGGKGKAVAMQPSVGPHHGALVLHGRF
ncbi:outer membrane protein assembly factor BamD [Paraliomyxa miuraensis]|uniref:hypothetical protein n=1 Tax=Paraliomyxa miuraensis TaxID=376150 RepID=UPI002257BC80|nr:hypothetical protein [Paraliomyxa miuraensis]MCX4240973.1 hypothetical protein [Paraliomyxa miuraensis]